jgi:hypothetical protein
MNENSIRVKVLKNETFRVSNPKTSNKIRDCYLIKLAGYEKLKSESDKFKSLKLQNLSFKNQILVNSVISNYDISVLKAKDKNFDFCFELRNSIILSLSNMLEV